MTQAYSDPSRESDPHALPNVEVFYMSSKSIEIDEWTDGDGEPMDKGWYYWYCFPGCMPDSDPIGPFATEAEALADARSAD
jgi:hypothetical protein